MIDLNQIEVSNYDTIPNGTAVRVELEIKRGNYNNADKGWFDGLVTKSQSGACYLNCILTILEGTYANRKVFTNIGLYSPNSPDFANIGGQTLRAIVESQRGLSSKDDGEAAIEKRKIKDYRDIEGIPFAIIISERLTNNGEKRNDIGKVLTADHARYQEVMEGSDERALPF